MIRLGFVVAATFAVGTATAAEWRHGIVQAKSDAGIVLMADHKGFADKYGLELDVQQFRGDAIILRALLAGELDSYEGNPGGPLLAASRGADLKIVGCYWPGLTYGIFAKPGITTLEQLSGKTVAISSPGSLPELLTRVALETKGIPANQVKFASMGSDADRVRALTAGVIDAAAVSSEFATAAKKLNLNLVAHAQDVAPNFLRFCTYVTGETLKARGEDVAKYLAAQMTGVRYALEHRAEAIALAQDTIKAMPDDTQAADILDEVARYSAIDPTMAVPVEKLKWMSELLVRTGNMKQPADLGKLVDVTARQRALTLLQDKP